MMLDEKGGYIIKRLSETIVVIQENWNDDISNQYITYLQGIEKALSGFERRREEINVRKSEIEQQCQSIIAGTEGQPKVRRRSY